MPFRIAVPISKSSRPRMVFASASGCSKISLSMKWGYSPFSACATSQSMPVASRSTGMLSKLRRSIFSGVTAAISPSVR